MSVTSPGAVVGPGTGVAVITAPFAWVHVGMIFRPVVWGFIVMVSNIGDEVGTPIWLPGEIDAALIGVGEDGNIWNCTIP